MPALNLIEKTALDTLVMSQIAEIRKRESALHKRLYSFSSGIKLKNQIECDKELLQLQQCTDRLSRLINAMSGY